MNSENESLALRYHQFGDPFESLRLESVSLVDPKPGFVVLKVLAAPINPADFGRINGSYGKLTDLPGTGGLEGVGEVVAAGSKSPSFPVGSRVIFGDEPGSWQTFATARESQLYRAPASLSDAQAAMFWVNPATAWRLLRDFETLQPGDWIVQNAATSAVGRLVIQFAAREGINTANLVRNLAAAEELKRLGATLVVRDDREAAKKVRDAIGAAPAKLGLNAVGGRSALTICKCLSDRATLVTYGGMDREPAPFPTRHLIFNDLSLRGLWINQWYRNASRSTIEAMHARIADAMEQGSIETPIAAAYPLQDWKKALEHSIKPGKPGKVVFKIAERSGTG